MSAKILPNPFNSLKLKIAESLHRGLSTIAREKQKSSISLHDIYHNITSCPKPDLGQFTFACFQTAKSFQIAPLELSKNLETIMEYSSLISKSQTSGPYLNLTLHLDQVLQFLHEQIHNNSYFHPQFFDQHENLMVEYSQPNTHKEMHVGHMRNVCLGSAMVALYKNLGHNVISSTYPGDMGTHVAKCLWYYKKHHLSPPETRRGAWLGSIYSQAHLELESQRGSDLEEKNRQDLTHILQEMHSGKGEFFELWKQTRQWSLDLMQDVYSWANVTFDHWFFESEVDQKSLQLVDEFYKKGIFVKDQGAIGIDLSADGLGFCLLKKSDGNGLYATKDLELARLKFEQFHITRNIYVVDVRQSLHFKQVFKTLEKMGFKHAAKSHHLSYEMVELPDGAMSSRKGNIIPIQTLIDEMEQTIKKDYLSKYINDWSEKDIDICARRIANAAIKYGMLKIDPAKKIIFDLAEWLKIDGNSGPYLLYSFARAGSILQKTAFNPTAYQETIVVNEPAERDLLMKMCFFNEAAFDAAEKNSPNILCNYLYELCQTLNTFYAQCNIMNAPTPSSKTTRLLLIYNFRQILKFGLTLLNIEPIEKM